jgi:hypothetical protein
MISDVYIVVFARYSLMVCCDALGCGAIGIPGIDIVDAFIDDDAWYVCIDGITVLLCI